MPNNDTMSNANANYTDAQIDRAVEAMAKADDYQTGYERCRWMLLKGALPSLSGSAVIVPVETLGKVREALEANRRHLLFFYEKEADNLAIAAELGVSEWESFMLEPYHATIAALSLLAALGGES